MNAYAGRRGTPRPPRDIEAEMEAAGAAGDDLRLDVADQRYQQWLVDNGYQHPQGSSRPDEAQR